MDSPISPSEFIYNLRGRQRSLQNTHLPTASLVRPQPASTGFGNQNVPAHVPQTHRPDAQRLQAEYRYHGSDSSSCMRQIDQICFEATQRYVNGQVNRQTQNKYPANVEIGISPRGSYENHRLHAASPSHGKSNALFQIEEYLFSINIRRICDGLWAPSWEDRHDIHRDRQAVGDMANLLDWSYTILHVEDDDTQSRLEAERCKIAAARKLCAFLGDLNSCDKIEEQVSLWNEASPRLG